MLHSEQATNDASAKERCERSLSEAFQAIRFSGEILRLIKEGRVPLNAALEGLELAVTQIENRIAEQSLAAEADSGTEEGNDDD
jgi:GTP cyclohydrolase II